MGLTTSLVVMVGSHFRRYPLLGRVRLPSINILRIFTFWTLQILEFWRFVFVGNDEPLSLDAVAADIAEAQRHGKLTTSLIFPEGAFVEAKTRLQSAAFAKKRDQARYLFRAFAPHVADPM